MLSTGVARGFSLFFFSLPLSPRLSPAPTGIFPSSSFFNLPGPGLQGAKSFVRDRNGLRISARASPICGRGSCGGEILKALGGIKEIFRLRETRRPARRIYAFFHFSATKRLHPDVIYAGTAGQAICELTPYSFACRVSSRLLLNFNVNVPPIGGEG